MKVIHWDCLEQMDKLIKQWIKVDAIITDPPYNVDIVWKGWWDSINNYEEFMKLFYKKCQRLTDNIIIFFDYSYTKLFEDIDVPFERFIWHREWWFRGIKIKKWYEPFYWYWDWIKYNRITEPNPYSEKDKRLKNNRTVSNVWKIPNLVWRKKESVWHPTQKPIKLIQRIVNMTTSEWDVILDPFAWSGTTGIACINTNRNYIMIEKEQKYIDVINKRIEDNQNLFNNQPKWKLIWVK
jgi:site-specific DNA-methyltransferase (adenine-specific)